MKSKNEVCHDAVTSAVEKLRAILGPDCSIVLLACWPEGQDSFESDQTNIGNYFAQEGMVREWLARREARRSEQQDLP